eukprot:COSAG02_NODE_36968_length_448_cov_0.799427_1_plen_149_part_11
MFFVTGGEALVLSSLDDPSPIAKLGPNDFCGEEALLMEVPRNAFVRVGGDAALEALALSKTDLLEVLGNYPALADVILAPIAEREISRENFEKARAQKLDAKAQKAQRGHPDPASTVALSPALGGNDVAATEDAAEADPVGSLTDAAKG